MAEIAILIPPALGAFFASVNAVMKIVSIIQKYRDDRDKRKNAGKGGGQKPARPPRMPKHSGDHRTRPYQHARNITNGSRFQSFSQFAGSSQQLAVRNPNPRLAHNASVDSFGGVIILTPPQQARDTHKDTSKYGVSTGARPSKSSETDAMKTAKAHWKSLKSGDASARAVAVVNFTKSNVTMFVEKHRTYYRSYKVKSCPDIAGFVSKYRRQEVCSGEVFDGKLVRCNHDITHVEDDRESVIQSSNCWMKLGISAAGIEREVTRDPIFIQMVRGAVFGLLCCVHKKPSAMNVDMRHENGVDFVQVDTDKKGKLEKGPDSCFSVFSFGSTNGWVREKVLVG